MTRANPPSESTRIVFLDYMRIFAFASVLIGHKFYIYLENFTSNLAYPDYLRFAATMVMPLFYGGAVGVVVFFLISGYIVTHVLQTQAAGTFAFKRLFRIYPLYIFAVLLQALLDFIITGRLPNAATLIPQLLLIGDFFQTPYALNGVEWTLRVELLFYILMTLVAKTGMLHRRKALLPYFYLALIAMLGLIPPVPWGEIWSKAYLNTYGPFLLLGSALYLGQKTHLSRMVTVAILLVTVVQAYRLLFKYHPDWIPMHPPGIAVLIFGLALTWRESLPRFAVVLALSDLTYSVYLFHNWLFDFFKWILVAPSWNAPTKDLIALTSLLIFCKLTLEFLEKPSIRAGNYLHKRLTPRRDGH